MKNVFAVYLIAAALIFGAAVQPSVGQAARATTASEVRMDHISIVATGKGPPVILIPGQSSPRAVWDGVVPGLAKHHRVYVVQVNGFGGDAVGANLTPGVLDGIVADLHAFIVREKITGAAVVGHSMGGLVAMMLAKAHPKDASRLMIVDSLPFIGTLFSPTATVAQIEPQAKAVRDAQVASYGTPVSKAVAIATANRLALKPESRAKVATWFTAADARVSGEAMYEAMSTDLRPAMKTIPVPITLIYPWGGELTKASAEAMYRSAYVDAPHVTFIDIGDAAHFVMLDQPVAFQAAVETFAEPSERP